MEEIHLSDSLKYVGDNAFLDCPNLTIYYAKDLSAVDGWSSNWCSLTPVVYDADDERVQQLQVICRTEGNYVKYGLFANGDNLKELIPTKYDMLFVFKECIVGAVRRFQYGSTTLELLGNAVVCFGLDGEIQETNFSEVLENAKAGTSSMQDVISFAKSYGFNKLEAEAHFRESQYYLDKNNYDKAMEETNIAYQLDSDLLDAKIFASTILNKKQAEEDRKRQEEWNRQQAELRRQQEEQRRQQEAYERQLARQRELERQQAKLKAVADVLGALAQTTYAVGNTIQQIHDLKHGKGYTNVQTQTQTTNRSTNAGTSSGYTSGYSTSSSRSSSASSYSSSSKNSSSSTSSSYGSTSSYSSSSSNNSSSYSKKEITCPSCRGTGKVKCSNCQGKGTCLCMECNPKGMTNYSSGGWKVCWKCHGTKKVKCGIADCNNGLVKCNRCWGKGTIKQ